jgi:hypothetical protein
MSDYCVHMARATTEQVKRVISGIRMQKSVILPWALQLTYISSVAHACSLIMHEKAAMTTVISVSSICSAINQVHWTTGNEC